MAIFSKLKASKDKTAPKDSKPSDTNGPVKRVPYVPRYAVRDALQCTPATFQVGLVSHSPSIGSQRNCSNPKFALSQSRNSSSLSLATMDNTTRPSSSRRQTGQPNPFASGSSSYMSINGLVAGDVPVPSIPAEYASQASIPRTIPRSQSYQQPGTLGTHLRSATSARPPISHSYTHSTMSTTKKVFVRDFGSTPMESPEESPVISRSDTPTEQEKRSSASSTGSGVSAEFMTMPVFHDSAHASPKMEAMNDQITSSYMSERRLEKSPVVTLAESQAKSQEQPRNYFTHVAKPAHSNSASPGEPPAKIPRWALFRANKGVVAH